MNNIKDKVLQCFADRNLSDTEWQGLENYINLRFAQTSFHLTRNYVIANYLELKTNDIEGLLDCHGSLSIENWKLLAEFKNNPCSEEIQGCVEPLLEKCFNQAFLNGDNRHGKYTNLY